MPTFPTYNAETARNAYNDYYKTKDATIDSVARKHGLTRNKVFAIIHKKGRFLQRELMWSGVTITLTRPERQMNRNEMIRAAGGDPNQER
jgi:hypothetical protein